MHITIEKLDVGYVVRKVSGLGAGGSRAAPTLEDAFKAAMFYLDGRSESFGGSLFGSVRVTFKNEPPAT